MQDYTHFETTPAQEVLAWAISEFGSRLAITTSFQADGMAVIDMAARISPAVRVVTLDTGRLPAETYDMMEMVRARYGVKVETVFPDAAEVEAMMTRHGPNLFYESVPMRNLCCTVRKVRPLERKMVEFDAWVVGLRRSQSASREEVPKVAEVKGKIKISPLADWTREQLHEYLKANDVPMHPLYAKGYPSIGCAPCTRPAGPDEDERAGRWWWEHGSPKECGLHFTPEGKIERTVDVLLREILESSHA